MQELKSELEALNLPTDGLKAALVERLEEALASGQEATGVDGATEGGSHSDTI